MTDYDTGDTDNAIVWCPYCGQTYYVRLGHNCAQGYMFGTWNPQSVSILMPEIIQRLDIIIELLNKIAREEQE